MALTRSNPATWAGLLGGAALSVPGVASAATLSQDAQPALSNELIPFALGCVTGAAVAGAIAVGVAHHNDVKSARDQADSVLSPETFSEQFSMRDAGGRGKDPAERPRERSRHASAASVSAGIGRHAKANREAMANWENTGSIRVQDVQGALKGSHFRGNVEVVPEHVVPEVVPLDVISNNDLEEVARDYARDRSFAGRVAARARGVASTLGSRISGDMMEGLPMIERADGSVADVGTGWWTKAAAEEGHSTGSFFPLPEIEADDSSFFSAPLYAAPSGDTAHQDGSDSTTGKLDVSAIRAEAIAARLSGIDQSVFPEERIASKPRHEDLWAQALAAMEEQTLPSVDEVEEVIGDMDTLDEIDGLEANTSFIPFRTPAGHPEVVDRETYVDYLIGDEFGRNPSNAARSTSREYLHVIEGGSQKMRHLRNDSDIVRPARPAGPRHLRAEARAAREA